MTRTTWLSATIFVALGGAASTTARAQDCFCEQAWSLPRGTLPEAPLSPSARGVVPDAAADAGPLDAAATDAAPPTVDAAELPDGGGPPPGPRKVPPNSRIFISWPDVDDSELSLRIDGGGDIDFTTEPVGMIPGQRWIIPSPFPRNSPILLSSPVRELRFETGDTPDQEAPVVRGLESQGARLQGDGCPPHLGGEIRLLGLQSPDTLDDVLYQVDLKRLGPPPEERVTLVLPAWSPLLGLVTSEDPADRACLANVAFAKLAWDYLATVHVYDSAYNMTERATKENGDPGNLLETEFRFADNPARGCGCRVGGRDGTTASGGAIAAVILGVFVSGRLRRNARSRARS